MKKGVKGKKRAGGFDRSKLNPMFMANAKQAKDNVQGWAFDFSNPDAGDAAANEESMMQKAMEESLKDSSKEPETDDKKDDKEGTKDSEMKEDKEKKEKEAAQTIKVTKKELLKKIEEENAKLLDTYQQDGSFVYELYAVMIHSGSAIGGHYYAYIKDIETGKWYNFNDSVVREISIIDVVETFGPEKTAAARNSLAAKRMAMANTSNAYMLMYRIFDPSEDRQTMNIHEDEIPDEVKADVELAEQQ